MVLYGKVAEIVDVYDLLGTEFGKSDVTLSLNKAGLLIVYKKLQKSSAV